MKNVRNTSRRQWKKALLMSFLASAAVLYLTSCSDSPEPIDTRMTSAYTDIQTEQTSPLASAETTAALETTDIAEPPDTDSPPLDPSDEIPQIHTEKEEIVYADDLSKIDDLIADAIAEEIEGGDPLWDLNS